MSQASRKGDALELAVRAIEGAILKDSPSYSDKAFNIYSKRVVTVQGVRHEIDIWVEVVLAQGYEARFVFECKNWEEKVSKNDVIIFIEKIRAVQAQHGFFVARSFTSDAEAQAKLEPRLTLLRATELESEGVPMPLGYHGIHVDAKEVRVTFLGPGAVPGEAMELVDISGGKLRIDGQLGDLPSYTLEWLAEERDLCTNAFPSGTKAEGLYQLPLEGHRTFMPGQLTIDDRPIESASIRGLVHVNVVRPVIVSHFDVETRGRAVTTSMTLGGNSVVTVFTMVPIRQGTT